MYGSEYEVKSSSICGDLVKSKDFSVWLLVNVDRGYRCLWTGAFFEYATIGVLYLAAILGCDFSQLHRCTELEQTGGKKD